jgi:hypothetical protein
MRRDVGVGQTVRNRRAEQVRLTLIDTAHHQAYPV